MIFAIKAESDLVKIAVTRKGFQGDSIEKLTRKRIDDGDLSSTVKEALTALGYSRENDRVILVIPSDLLTSRMLTMPLTKRSQIMEALPFEIESATPFDAEEIICGYLPVEPVDSGTRLLAIVVRKNDMETFLEPYIAAGIRPDMVLPEPLVVASVQSAIPENPRGSIIIFVGLKKQSSYITAVSGSKPVSFHTLPLTEGSTAEQQALEVKRTVMSLQKNDPEAVLNRVSIVTSSKNNPLIFELKRLLKVDVDQMDLPINVAIEDMDDGAALPEAQFLDVAGAAMMAMERRADNIVNLRPGGRGRLTGISGSRTQLMMTGILLLLVLLVWGISHFSEQMRIDNRYQSLKDGIRAEFNKALPNVTNVVDETQQLKNALKKIENKSKMLGSLTDEGDPFLDRFLDITNAVPENARLDVDELVYEPGSMIISGRTGSFEKVDKLKKNIDNLSWTNKVSVTKAKAGITAGEVSFRLEAKLQ